MYIIRQRERHPLCQPPCHWHEGTSTSTSQQTATSHHTLHTAFSNIYICYCIENLYHPRLNNEKYTLHTQQGMRWHIIWFGPFICWREACGGGGNDNGGQLSLFWAILEWVACKTPVSTNPQQKQDHLSFFASVFARARERGEIFPPRATKNF